MNKKVKLQEIHDDRGSRYLDAHLSSDGNLVIEGQDIGKSTGDLFGGGASEYEYAYKIAEEHIPALLGALASEDEILPALKKFFASGERVSFKEFLEEHEIDFEFWSMVG